MSAQNNLEKILKEIHIMVSECPTLKGDPNQVVLDKTVLFSKLNDVSKCFYDMLDEFELSSMQKKEARYQLKKEYEKTMDDATAKAEDVYSASVLYTDEAITRLIRILNQSEKSVEQLYVDFEKKLRTQQDQIRANQKELQDILFDLRDSNLYLNLLNDRRRIIEQEQEKKKKEEVSGYHSPQTAVFPKPEIKINKQYFEQMGLNEDGTPKIKEEKKTEKPEIKVDTNSNYFKWKMSQQKKESAEETKENEKNESES
ncbi:MAG: hypothetical protein ACI39H_09485 [Lachnospiraceae bacterium]